MMMYLFLALFFICLQGFFAGMETGMVSILRPRAEHAAKNESGSSSSGARMVLFFLTHPGIMIATTLLGVNICVVFASLMAKKFMEECGLHGNSGILISTCILSVVLLSCEIIPKNWFRQAPFERCTHFIRLLYVTYLILYVPVRLFAAFTAFLNSSFAEKPGEKGGGGGGNENAASGGGGKGGSNAVMRENFRLFLRESEGSGSVDSETAGILDRAMGFPALTLGDIMIPLPEVPDIPSTFTMREAFNFAQSRGVEKLPVYIPDSSGAKTQWCAIFSIYEAMYAVNDNLWDTVRVTGCVTHIQMMRSDAKIIDALDISRKRRISLFVITDAKGSQLGVVPPEKIASMLFE